MQVQMLGLDGLCCLPSSCFWPGGLHGWCSTGLSYLGRQLLLSVGLRGTVDPRPNWEELWGCMGRGAGLQGHKAGRVWQQSTDSRALKGISNHLLLAGGAFPQALSLLCCCSYEWHVGKGMRFAIKERAGKKNSRSLPLNVSLLLRPGKLKQHEMLPCSTHGGGEGSGHVAHTSQALTIFQRNPEGGGTAACNGSQKAGMRLYKNLSSLTLLLKALIDFL